MMEDERASQLSAMFDGELPPAECELVARRLARDEDQRRAWGSYALIGAAIRGELVAGRAVPAVSADLAARVREAVARDDGRGVAADDDASDVVGSDVGPAGTRPPPRLPRWAVPLSGAGLAAGIAAAAVLWLRTGSPTAANVAAVVPAVRPAAPEIIIPAPLPAAPVARAAAAGAASKAPDSYTVPPPPKDAVGLQGGASLANMIVAHSEVSAPMLRRNALSTLVTVPVETVGAAGVEEIVAPGAGLSDGEGDRP